MLVLGIEGTAHTFGIGLIRLQDNKLEVLVNERDMYKPEKGGIHPSEAAKHHKEISNKVLRAALEKAKLELSCNLEEVIEKVDAIAYSAGPGLPPCLKVTMEFARDLAKEYEKPLVQVNHGIAHLEIARLLCNATDPIYLYVSGGNTQVIGYADGRYRVFGETLDIAIGNALDTFGREVGLEFPAGPKIAELAEKGKNYIELPYVVKGMDLSFSGIMTAALKKYKEFLVGEKYNEEYRIVAAQKDKAAQLLYDLCFSLQETCFAMLTEVVERALAHTGKKEVILTGGVAASKRLQEMLRIMCEERGARFAVCPREYTGDNGAMIGVAGALQQLTSPITSAKLSYEAADFNAKWRPDEVEVTWI